MAYLTTCSGCGVRYKAPYGSGTPTHGDSYRFCSRACAERGQLRPCACEHPLPDEHGDCFWCGRDVPFHKASPAAVGADDPFSGNSTGTAVGADPGRKAGTPPRVEIPALGLGRSFVGAVE